MDDKARQLELYRVQQKLQGYWDRSGQLEIDLDVPSSSEYRSRFYGRRMNCVFRVHRAIEMNLRQGRKLGIARIRESQRQADKE